MIRNSLNSIIQNKNALMFITALIFMAGILSYFNDNAVLISAVISVVAIILLIKNYVSTKYVLLLIFMFYFGFFNTCFKIHSTDALVPYSENKVTLKGQIVSIPNSGVAEKSKFFLKVFELDGNNISGKTFVTVTSDDNDFSKFQIGNYYELKGRLKTPFKAGNPSQFDYGKYLKNFDTFTVFYADESDCESIEKDLTFKWTFLQNLNILRDKIITVHSQYLQSPNLEILGGIVFGDDAVAPPDYIKASFINSGLLHILAASGMNVAFIYAFWVFFMKRIRAPFKFTVVSGMLLVVLYTFMTGLGASVIRAALMLLFILAGKLIDRDSNTVSLLAFVAMLMLIYNPAFINDVGFQLSFVVTFGLLTSANVIFEKCKENKFLNWILGFILIPVVAQIWVAPIQMFYFNTFSSYSIFANILSVPFLSVVSFGGFISSIFAIFPFADKICFILDFVLNYVLHIIVFISNFFANLPNSILSTTHPSVIQICLYYAILLLLTLSIKIGLNRKIILSCAGLIVLIFLLMINIPSNNLQIIIFDVQNADCFLIRTPRQKYFIIDTGRAGFKGGKAQANSIIIKYLKDKGIKNIDGMIITHFDNDHSGGAVDIMNNFNIKKVYLNSFDNKSVTSENIYKTIKEKELYAEIPKGEIYSEDNLILKTFIADKKDDNDKSVITLLSFKGFDMLFTGDAGVGAFSELKNYIPHNIEVLKVGHHGGNNVVNSNMIEHLNNKISIISTGPNAFGHPTKGTLDILRNTDIYRTDRHNSIEILSDGEKYSLYLFNPQKHKYELSKEYNVISP